MLIRTEPLKLYYAGLKKPAEFNWFMCGSVYEDGIGLKFIELSPKTKFFSERSGKNYTTTENTKIVLMDCHKNREILKNNGAQIECKSKKKILSKKCDITNHPERALKTALELGYDGIVYRYEHGDKHDECTSECVSTDSIFLIKASNLLPIKEECGFVAYAKKNNTTLREKYYDFPSYEEIEKSSEKYGCDVVNRALYAYMSSL